MKRDDRFDVWVQLCDDDWLDAVYRAATPHCVRYSPTSQVEELERKRDEWSKRAKAVASKLWSYPPGQSPETDTDDHLRILIALELAEPTDNGVTELRLELDGAKKRIAELESGAYIDIAKRLGISEEFSSSETPEYQRGHRDSLLTIGAKTLKWIKETESLEHTAKVYLAQLDTAERDRDNWKQATYNAESKLKSARESIAELESEREETLSTMAGLSSYLGAGLGDEQTTTMAQYLERIRWGIDDHTKATSSMIQDKDKRIAELEGECRRFLECMRVAGLECFMRKGTPEQVAEHLRSVAKSYESFPPRCKDGCKHWLVDHCASCFGLPEGACEEDGSSFCSNHTGLECPSK